MAGRIIAQTRGPLLLQAEMQMQPHLFVEFALKAPAVQEHIDSPFEFARQAHVILSFRRSE